MKLNNILLVAGLVVLSQTVVASQQRPPKQPPPEAFEACVNMQSGDAVTIKTPRGDVLKATCQYINESEQENDVLVAVPLDHKPKREKKEK